LHAHLFDKPKNARLVRIDLVNEKFGKGALVYGDAAPRHSSKIAFQRVPKLNRGSRILRSCGMLLLTL
jgi:hypothetical protein